MVDWECHIILLNIVVPWVVLRLPLFLMSPPWASLVNHEVPDIRKVWDFKRIMINDKFHTSFQVSVLNQSLSFALGFTLNTNSLEHHNRYLHSIFLLQKSERTTDTVLCLYRSHSLITEVRQLFYCVWQHRMSVIWFFLIAILIQSAKTSNSMMQQTCLISFTQWHVHKPETWLILVFPLQIIVSFIF